MGCLLVQFLFVNAAFAPSPDALLYDVYEVRPFWLSPLPQACFNRQLLVSSLNHRLVCIAVLQNGQGARDQLLDCRCVRLVLAVVVLFRYVACTHARILHFVRSGYTRSCSRA